MQDEVITFLGAYTPRAICPECLAGVMQQEMIAVTNDMNSHVVGGRAESHRGVRALRRDAYRLSVALDGTSGAVTVPRETKQPIAYIDQNIISDIVKAKGTDRPA
jgi:hypothetical protein